MCEDGCCCCRGGGRRGVVVVVVFIALLLDNLLLTSVVPILPNYIRDIERGTSGGVNETSSEWPPLPHHHTHSVPQLQTSSVQGTTSGPVNKTGQYAHENTRIGLLFASKTFVQLICNVWAGPLTNRIGYTVPMFAGFMILLISTTAFAFGRTYVVLFGARALQGVGTALTTTSGLGLVASIYPDQRERGLAQTIAFSGLAAGVLLGPPYGGGLFELTGGKEVPCIILAVVALGEGFIQGIFFHPRIQREEQVGPSLLTLLCDPYILITALTIMFANLTVAVLEPTLPVWMFYTMGASEWLQGVAFVPSTLTYLLFMQVLGAVTHRLICFKVSNRWQLALCGLIIASGSIALVPMCSNMFQLIGPLAILGLASALISSTMVPHIGYLVDHRHAPVYGTAYAITDNAFCLSFAIGPAISGPLMDSIGFKWTLWCTALVALLPAPMVVLLKNPPGREQLMEAKKGESLEENNEKSLLLSQRSNAIANPPSREINHAND